MKIYVVIENWCDGVTMSSSSAISYHLTEEGAELRCADWKRQNSDPNIEYYVNECEVED